MDWDGLRLLLEVARVGSFLRAAEGLGVATSTVSRRISALEAAVGERLLERASDGCRLTERGARFAEAARRFERELRRAGSMESLQGTVTVACSDGFTPLLIEVTSRFEERHPGCVVELAVANDYVRLSRGEADVALRMAHLGEPSLIYRRLGAMPYGYFGAPALLERLGGARPEEVPFVSVLPPLDRSAQARAATAAGFVRVRVRTDSFAAQLEAVRAGLGVAALPRATAGGLVEVFSELTLPDVEVFLVTRPAVARQPHVRAFIDALVEASEEAAT